MPRRDLRLPLDLAIAFGLSAAALLLRKLLPIEPGVGLYPLPLTAIIVSAWRGGRGPGLLATAVTSAGIALWLLPAEHALTSDPDTAMGFAIFVAVALLAVEFSMGRRRAERALRDGEARLRQIAAYLAEAQRLSHTGSWAWVPATGEIRYLSEECRRILGLEAEEGSARLVGSLLARMRTPDLASARETLAGAVRAGRDFELDYRLDLPDGSTRDIYVIGHPVFDGAGGIAEFVGTLVDVTERRRAEEERERLQQAQSDLERSNRVSTMGELAASLAHEIRQPIAAALTNARTCLRWLERGEPEVAEARAAAARAAEDVTRAAEIVTRVRSMFQKESPRREPADLNAVVGEVASVLRREAHRRAVALRTELAPGLPGVAVDRVQVQQVLMNLILNGIDAVQAGGPPREVVVETVRHPEGCLVSVADTGPGLPPGQADRVFDAFFTTKPGGTGMGLPISRSIVEAHGGRLWAEPGRERGAAFRFTLPAAGGPAR
jgi:PAS domain S-box-containing protein